MTARIVITCDAVHPERTPPECRAFLSVNTATITVADREAVRNGWTWSPLTGRDICPSCRQKEAQ